MFESMDTNLLTKLSELFSGELDSHNVFLDEYSACLEVGRKECFNGNADKRFDAMQLRQIDAGFLSAQQILATLLNKKT